MVMMHIDISQDSYDMEEKIFEVLTELEDLCSECVSYESFIEWKVS